MSKSDKPQQRSSPALMLLADAMVVIPLRIAKIARGGSAGRSEARLMVTEKVAAGAELLSELATGRLGRDPCKAIGRIIQCLGSKVRANRKRLGG